MKNVGTGTRVLTPFLPLLKCIECGASGQLMEGNRGLSCPQCGRDYELHEGVLVVRRGYKLRDALRRKPRGFPHELAERPGLVGKAGLRLVRRLGVTQEKAMRMRRQQFHFLTTNVLPKSLTKTIGLALEIGAGSFAQAAELATVSELVVATEYDVAARSGSRPMAVPQRVMPICADARELPVRDAAADLLFSSNVLEHVPDPRDAPREGKRCLAKDGTMVHVVPTTACRIRTALTRPLASLFRFDPRLSALWQRTFAVHGAAAKSYVEELRLFSARRWRSLLRECGLAILDEGPILGFWSANIDVGWTAAPLFWLGRSEHYFVVA